MCLSYFSVRHPLWLKLPQALQIPHLKRAQSIIARYDAGEKSSIAEIAREELQDIRRTIIDRVAAEEREAEEKRREAEARAKAEQVKVEQAKAAEVKAAQQEEEAKIKAVELALQEAKAAREEEAKKSAELARQEAITAGEKAAIKDNESQSVTVAAGWQEMVDPDTGDRFYHHAATGQTTWERPPSTEDGTVLAATAANDESPAPDNDWKEMQDAETGGTFYYLAATGETAWERPSLLVVDEGSSAASKMSTTDSVDAADSGAANEGTDSEYSAVMVDPGSGSKYRTHLKTGVSEWIAAETTAESGGSGGSGGMANPSIRRRTDTFFTAYDSGGASAGKADSAVINTAGVPAVVTTGWQEMLDPDTGGVFFYHAATGNTSWEPPLTNDDAVTEGATETLPIEVEGWQTMTDPATGGTFYYDPVSGETSWEQPLEPPTTLPGGEERMTGSEPVPSFGGVQDNINVLEGERLESTGNAEVKEGGDDESF